MLDDQTHQYSIPYHFFCAETAKWRFMYHWNKVVQRKMRRVYRESFVQTYSAIFNTWDEIGQDPLDWVVE